MPELPEVETTRRGLIPLLGQTVQAVVIRNAAMRWPIPPHLPDTLHGQVLQDLSRRAKYILARFDTGTLILHLGMSGRICLLATDDPPGKHDHFDIHFEGGQVLRLRDPRRFGAVLWVGNQEMDTLDSLQLESTNLAAQDSVGLAVPPSVGSNVHRHALIASLGPEPLDAAFNGDYLYKQLRSRSAAIKTTIMDSHLVVGVGNIYASESLFRSRIDPRTAANKLSLARSKRLAEEIKLTLADAIEAGGSSLRDFFGADGNPGYFQQSYFVYGRTGQPCRVCQTPIQLIKQGQRSTFYCPLCQR